MSDRAGKNNKRPNSKGAGPTRSFDDSTPGPGSQIGPFRIERELGRGAVGVVYLAHDTKLNRSVAIKSLPAEVMANPKARSRFAREARLLASLNHPNIATIYEEFKEAEGVGYLILEYVPGQTLAERIAKSRLKLEETLSIALQIAEAVAAAHEHDVIHRDLKPGNIKITPEGKVKVLDFGLAKAVGAQAANQQSTVTEPGRIIGTPAYMSPEQARGKPTDKRSDIWSFGCVMYEMLTGRIPFKGETISDTLANILQTDPNWQALPQSTPANIQVLLRRCLQKDPRRRLQHIGDARIEISDTLERDASSRGDEAIETGHGRLIPLRQVMLVCLVCVALGAVAAVIKVLGLTDKKTPAVPPYKFRVEPVENIPAIIMAYAGPGKGPFASSKQEENKDDVRDRTGLNAPAPTGMSLTKVGQSKVDRAVTIEGQWGTFINGKSYQQMPLDTFKGWQYATYYDRQRRLSIARRKLPDGTWEIIHFDDYIYEGDDNHNVTVLGICPNDGTIHLAFDHHGVPLHYRVSKPGVASEPEKAAWTAELFSEVRDWLQPGKHIESVTYPRFVPMPQGNLLFVSRDGTATNGKVTLCEYDPARGGWSERWPVTNNKRTYEFEGRTSDSRYAYLNGVHYHDPSGRLHMSWCWRESMAHTFVGVNYAYSDDNGRTWFNSDGRQIGGPGQLIHVHSPGIAVWDVGPHDGLDNQEGQYVDALGRPHILVWHRRNGEPILEIGKRDPSKSAYYHYWRDADGTWHQNELPYPVDDTERNRPKILSLPDNDLIAMFNYKGKIVLCGATVENQYRNWGTLHIEEGPWDGEPLPDLTRWRTEGVLSIYMQKDPLQVAEPTELYVLDFELHLPQ